MYSVNLLLELLCLVATSLLVLAAYFCLSLSLLKTWIYFLKMLSSGIRSFFYPDIFWVTFWTTMNISFLSVSYITRCNLYMWCPCASFKMNFRFTCNEPLLDELCIIIQYALIDWKTVSLISTGDASYFYQTIRLQYLIKRLVVWLGLERHFLIPWSTSLTRWFAEYKLWFKLAALCVLHH